MTTQSAPPLQCVNELDDPVHELVGHMVYVRVAIVLHIKVFPFPRTYVVNVDSRVGLSKAVHEPGVQGDQQSAAFQLVSYSFYSLAQCIQS